MELTEKWLKLAGIPRRFWEVSVDKIKFGYKKDVVFMYGKIGEVIRNGAGYLLVGPRGSGKTAAAVILQKRAMRIGYSTLFARVDDINEIIIEKRLHPSGGTFFRRMLGVDLLVLDDLYQEYGKGFSLAMVERIIRNRSDAKKSTIATSNGNYDMLKSRYGDLCMEFIGSCMATVVIDGGDWRKIERKNMQQYVPK